MSLRIVPFVYSKRAAAARSLVFGLSTIDRFVAVSSEPLVELPGPEAPLPRSQMLPRSGGRCCWRAHSAQRRHGSWADGGAAWTRPRRWPRWPRCNCVPRRAAARCRLETAGVAALAALRSVPAARSWRRLARRRRLALIHVGEALARAWGSLRARMRPPARAVLYQWGTGAPRRAHVWSRARPAPTPLLRKLSTVKFKAVPSILLYITVHRTAHLHAMLHASRSRTQSSESDLTVTARGTGTRNSQRSRISALYF